LQQQVASYYNTHIRDTLIPWRTEMAIRSATDIRLVGVVDALFMDGSRETTPDDTLVLHLKDWKYSQDVSSCLSEYTLQLNMYKFILESHYTGMNFVVDGVTYMHISIATMELVVFHEAMATFAIHRVPDIQSVVYDQMEARKRCM
jgi:hypothetical protein